MLIYSRMVPKSHECESEVRGWDKIFIFNVQKAHNHNLHHQPSKELLCSTECGFYLWSSFRRSFKNAVNCLITIVKQIFEMSGSRRFFSPFPFFEAQNETRKRWKAKMKITSCQRFLWNSTFSYTACFVSRKKTLLIDSLFFLSWFPFSYVFVSNFIKRAQNFIIEHSRTKKTK